MEHRVLGRTDLRVSALGLGGAGVGNLYRTFEDDESAAEVIRCALDLGVTYIDTAPLYGKGASERRIGLALRGHPARERCVVATKVGYIPEDYDHSEPATERSVHDSLERLGLERLPLVQIHELSPENWDVAMAPGGAADTLRRLQSEGLIGWVGITGSDGPTLQRAVDERPDAFDTIFVWKHFHLLDWSFAALVAHAAALGKGVIVGTPFAGGLLASGSGPGAKFFYKDAPEEPLARTRILEARCAEAGVPLGAAALRFCLDGPGVATVVAGADTVEQVRENVALLSAEVSAALVERLQST